jgi:hypothetical protein
MGSHVDTRERRRKQIKEHDESARKRRASFKQYLRRVEEEFLEDELPDEIDDDADQDE